MFTNEEIYEFMMCNPVSGSKLSYARVHTQSIMDEQVEVRAGSAEDLCNIDNGCVLLVVWKDGWTTAYYKKCDNWVIVLARS